MKGLIIISVVSSFVVILGMAITMMVMCLCGPISGAEEEKDSKSGERQPTANFDDNSDDGENEDMVQYSKKNKSQAAGGENYHGRHRTNL